ncbi:MAG: hypothetical protein ABOK23_10835 [Candidatus Methanoperedens sp.]|nr:hypothetical protein [Candidatus Methanoperedens sp.]
MKLDNIELFKEEIRRKDLQLIQKIHKRDMLLIEERFKKWEKGNGWDDFIRMVEGDADNGKETTKVEFTPIKMMCKFIENGGDPLVYLKAISISYPEHPFCQMLIECETVGQFLNKLKQMEAQLPILFQTDGKKWLSELFEVSKGFVREEYESGTQSAVDIASACA